MPELSDLPLEILRMIAERCDFRSRFNLQSSSKLMKEVVDQSKFVLNFVGLEIMYPRSLWMSFQYANQDGNITHHKIKMGIENADSMETTAKWMANILKNAEIGCFHFFVNHNAVSVDSVKELIKMVKDNLSLPLKIRTIYWGTKIDPFSICDKSYAQRLNCQHDDPNFFQEYKEVLINLDQVILNESMNIMDQDVLSMKATQTNLNSESFSAGMINHLVDKFLAKGLIDSQFFITNPKGNFITEIKVPNGFSNPTEIRGRYEKIDGNKKMKLIVDNDSVGFRID